MPLNAVWELKLLIPYIRISTATIGSVPTALKAVPSPQAKPAKNRREKLRLRAVHGRPMAR